ncbi:MAG: hypothetical protein JO095_19130 [Alphaproteobacteria bacterium]|nr:hypothetical protein [Alphaproteobacteria bacterium]
MEGLNNGAPGTGYAYWYYHYLDAQGLPAQIGGQVPGNWCGEHTFAADYGTGAITYYYDGNQVGQVTAAEIGVPLVSDPMNVIMDYGAGGYGGPTTPGAVMNVNSFSASSDSMTVTPPVSQANPQQVCDGAPLCLSNTGRWPGSSVRMNDPGVSNEDYQLQAVNACGGTDWVHYAPVDGWNCPFANASLDQAFDHLGIGQLTSSTPGLCVSSGPTGRAVLGTCADPSDGSGGAAGVLQVYSGDSSCLASNGDAYLVNQYWSDSQGASAYLISGGAKEARAYFSATAPATCWSGL